jgi:HNH endonuclease
VFISKYIKNETVPSFDKFVSTAIEEYGIEGGGKTMKIAIENFDGKIYRVLDAVGLGTYIHATSSLLEIGLDDLLADSINGEGGYDSRFVVSDLMRSAVSVELETTSDPASEILAELDELNKLPETERQSIVLSRVGQGTFRAQLVSYWKACAVTGADCKPLLKASHVKPWSKSNNRERLDVFNGLLLSPNIDSAFDSGYITFDDQGKILFSSVFVGSPAFQFHMNAKLRINQKLFCQEHRSYLEYHRSEIFKN